MSSDTLLITGVNAFGTDLFQRLSGSNTGKNIFFCPPAILSSLSATHASKLLDLDENENVDKFLFDFKNDTMNDIRIDTVGASKRSDIIDTIQEMKPVTCSYFKGAWLKPFDRSQTEKRPFFNHGNCKNPVQLDFISRWNHGHDVSKPGSYDFKVTTIRIPLKSSLNLIIFTPSTNLDMEKFESQFSPQLVNDLLDDSSFMQLKVVSIPKFSLCSSVPLNDPLMKIFGTENFFPSKNYEPEGVLNEPDQGAINESLISQAKIVIDEEGSEGVPPKEMYVAKNSLNVANKPSVIVDRPFIFLIRNNSGLILFMGKINAL